MIFPEIKYLYKYMPWNKYTTSSLINRTFWFSRPEKFNDPFDCGIKLLTNSKTPAFTKLTETTTDVISLLTQLIKNSESPEIFREHLQGYQKNLEKLQPAILQEVHGRQQDHLISDQMKEKISKIGVLSLSETCENMLMWSHYADQHEGICVEIERTASNDLGNKLITLPVRYSVKKPELNSSDYRNGTEKDKIEIERSLIYTKSNSWSYEREWRVIKESLGDSNQFLDAKIKSITIGARASKDTRNIISLLSLQRGFEVKSAELNELNFDLDIKTIPPALI